MTQTARVKLTSTSLQTWEKVLYVAPDTGCGDLALDPADPAIVYAGMWQDRREPWFFTSGGPKSGLYRSTDGGSTWQAVRQGLPAGDLGRIALAPSPARAGRVWATVEAKKTALYRSEDHGASWTEVNSSSVVTGRPFYFAHLVADPASADRVYKPAFGVGVSDDAGATFSGLGGGGMFGPSFHGDVHALWVNPKNPEQLVIGTDGGVYVSYLRWPNDLLVNGRKCAGILVEMRAEPHRIDHVLMGIGINVNQTEFPEGLEAVMELPGVGRSTAGAILALSRGERHPILDGNVKRVLTRYFGIVGYPGEPAVEKRLWALAEACTPPQQVAEDTQAIMAPRRNRLHPGAAGMLVVPADLRLRGARGESP